ncbi:hypothetical protein NP493_389g02011 [Ridgeia piscesae]|uniref:Cytochrome b-245 light chain n=1 Tax=Ridgeia piscesae TaxID=27915 RepID=A0AAD9L215_RIDPI|nr:hypothetical protein NP493_389g02011 [Ridgeia piscesae]
MGQIEWAMWANEQAIVGVVVLFLGGVVGVSGQFPNWQIAAYAITVALLVVLLEYPRPKRSHGTTMERSLSIPCCFILPTVVGAMCLIIAGLIYLVAAIKGEEWKPVEHIKDVAIVTRSEPPSRPPPRQPVTRHYDTVQEAENRM